MIDKKDLKKGSIYKLRSRNLAYGVFDGDRGFIGIREKLGSEFLFREYYADGSPYGTVQPLEEVGAISGAVEIAETLGSRCSICGKRAWWTGPPSPAPWACEGSCSPDEIRGYSVSNRALFRQLEAIQAAASEGLT